MKRLYCDVCGEYRNGKFWWGRATTIKDCNHKIKFIYCPDCTEFTNVDIFELILKRWEDK